MLREHLERFGTPPTRGAARLAQLADSAGLRGRGGAGFPTGTKLAAVARRSKQAIVVANGTEGEPASAKDKALLRLVPHLVLDGVTLAAAAVGAEEAIVAVGAGARNELRVVNAALAERRHARVDRVPLKLVAAPDTFVGGEETALVNWLNDGPPKPTFTPPRPFERGVRGRPTLVQNVETLANLALIARFGPEWFRSVGTEAEPGSVLVTLAGAIAAPGVYELALGTPLREVVRVAGGVTERISAVLAGGYFGSWISGDDAARIALTDADLRTVGASLGARTIAFLPATTCGVLETARITRWLAAESAGQCGPCVHGLAAVSGALERLARRQGDDERLPRWLDLVEGRGGCAHPDGAVRFVRSARRVFAREFELHAAGRCSGGGRPVLPLRERRAG
jgi:NADH:ubiquinone oxidoreductase subunit F (NADH-binding)